MKKIIIILVLMCFAFVGRTQVFQSMNQYGYGPVKRMWVDSTLMIPTVCGIPTLKTYVTNHAAIAYDSCNKRLYFYDPKLMAWDTIKGGLIDTLSLSSRIDERVRYSDTAGMLSPYAKITALVGKVDSINKSTDSVYYYKNGVKYFAFRDSAGAIDTTSLSNRINLKLNASDSTIYQTKYRTDSMRVNIYAALLGKVDSIKKSADSVYYYKAGVKYLAFRDSSGGASGTYVPYTGATQDVDLGANGLDAKFIKITGMAGAGHLDLKHQSGDASGQGNTTSIYANSSGYIKWKNDNLYYTTLATPQTADRVYTFENKSYTLGDSADIAARVKYSDTASMLTPYVHYSDSSAIYQTKYRTDTMRTNIYATLNGKVKYSDTSAMLSAYARKRGINLQSVTDSGNVTTNDVYVRELYLTDEPNSGYGKISIQDNVFGIQDYQGNTIFGIEPSVYRLYDASNHGANLNVSLSNTRDFYLPDTSGTFSLRGDSTLFQTKYRSDTSRTNTYNAISTKLNISDTANKWVNNITRTPGKDSIIFYIGSTRYAIKDSVGGGGGSQTLQSVTDNGNTTTNDIKINQLYLKDTTSLNYSKIMADDNLLKYYDTGNIFRFGVNGESLLMNNFNNKTSYISYNGITDGRAFILPDTDGTFAMRGDSTLFQTKYRSDTARTNVYNALNGKQSTLTFSTGLTNTSGTVTADLSTGKSGGQAVNGGTAASDTLRLFSTTNATKGKIIFGNSAYDEANNRLGIGTTSPGTPVDIQATLTNTAAAAAAGVQGVNTIAPATNSSAAWRAMSFSNQFNSTVNYTQGGIGILTGAGYFENRVLKAGTIDMIQAVHAANILPTAMTAAGTITDAIGVASTPFNSFGNAVSSTITNARGFCYVQGANNGGLLTVTNQAAISIPALVNATNSTAILMGTNTIPSGNWGIYNSSSNANYFAGNLLVNTTTNAGYKLDVNGTTRLNGNTTFGTTGFFDNTNTRFGIGQQSPTSRLHLNFNQNSVSQNDANGILLANSTAATNGTQSISPPIVWQGNGWKTNATAASQDVRFRADVLPVQGAANPTATWQLAANVNSGGYSNVLAISSTGAVTFQATNTAAGTTGNQTINKASGTVNIAAGNSAVTVTNSLVTTSSIVFAVVRTNDATAVIKNVVPGSGTFDINLNAAATAETSIGFFVIN